MPRNRSNRMTGLGELQLQVLDILDRLEEGSVYDVLDAFPGAECPRYTTVLTVLRSLEKQSLVSHTTRDRSHVFRPTAASGQVRQRLLGDLLQRVFGGSPRDLVAALLDGDAVTPEALAELKRLIAQREVGSDDP